MTKRPASEIASRVLERLAAAALDDKQRELLMKLRKGADASLTFGQLVKVLALLGGWKVEKYVGMVKADWNDSRGYFGENEAAARHTFEQMKKEESPASTAPQKGKKYTMNVTDFRDSSSPNHPFFTFKYDVFYGAECFRITSPEGKTFEQLPDAGWLSRGKMRYWLHDVLPWLKKETSYRAQIDSALGLSQTYEQEKRERSLPRTRENTGTCPCCFRNIKLRPSNPQTMVLHGYLRPGWGSVHGECFGVQYEPFEISPKGTQDLVHKHLIPHEATLQQYLKDLKSGSVVRIRSAGGVVQTPETPHWDKIVDETTRQTEHTIKGLQHDIKLLSQMIADWKEAPLPTEGVKTKEPPAFLR